MKRWLFLIAIAAALTLALRIFVVEGIYIATASMEPTLGVGEHYFTEKISYALRAPYRGEIVVFESPVRKGRYLVKRVIALPGERVEVREKKVIINGRALEETYARHTRAFEKLEGDNIPEMSVPADSFFVLGDNRDESDDSSVWKNPETGEHIYFVGRDKITGRLMVPFK